MESSDEVEMWLMNRQASVAPATNDNVAGAVTKLSFKRRQASITKRLASSVSSAVQLICE